MQNKIISQSLSAFRIILISSLTIFTLYTVQAWVSPTLSAPNGNVGGPLTTATTTQVKTGSLGLLDSLSIGNNLIINGTTTSLGNILVNGGIIATGTITATGKIIANGGFQLITGAASGTVLMSDTSGNTSWQTMETGVTYYPGVSSCPAGKTLLAKNWISVSAFSGAVAPNCNNGGCGGSTNCIAGGLSSNAPSCLYVYDSYCGRPIQKTCTASTWNGVLCY